MAKDYISREAAIKKMKDLHFNCKDFHICGGVLLELNALDSIPAADVVEVVRCRECKHNGTRYTRQFYQWCDEHHEYHVPNWFCADGECENGGQDDV